MFSYSKQNDLIMAIKLVEIAKPQDVLDGFWIRQRERDWDVSWDHQMKVR